MFAAARLMLLNKTDLLPHVDFDVEQCLDYARRVNPDLQILQLSARTGDGLEAWLDWVRQGQQAALAQQVSRLEAKLATVRAYLGRGAR
jgi:hydrogenase nickel incorporation protein HypB